ncbi:MAG: membrane protein insertase YidC [Hyphomicrobiaceae bacterium]
MDENNNRNFFLAIALSMLILVGWQYFYAGPMMEKERLRQEQLRKDSQAAGGGTAATTETGAGTLPETGTGASSGGTAAVPGASVGATATREAALAQSPRVAIETPSLKGSVSLKGARIDDIVLVQYHETTDRRSPNVVLFSPAGGPDAYYADYGFLGTGVKLPDANSVWTAVSKGPLTPAAPLVLAFDNGEGLVFRRTISVDDKYLLTISDEVENKGTAPIALTSYGLVSRHGEPHSLNQWVIHEGFIGIQSDKLKELTYKNAKGGEVEEFKDTTGGWLGITDKYWAAVMIPPADQPYNSRFKWFAGGNGSYQADYAAATPQTIAPGAKVTIASRLFAGAKQVQVIDAYKEKFGVTRFEYLIDWGWFWFITKPMFYVIDYLYRFIGNFGLAILLVTVLVKALFFPLANKSYAAMSKMKKLQPEMQKLQERFKDDKMRQQQALMELYKKEKVNPMAGCLPILVQIPVFFALYKVLFVTIEMRHAPFFGWIHDLSAPDPTSIFNLFGLIPIELPHILHLGIWPIIMGLTMWLQMKLNPPPPDPVQKRIFSWMPLIFTFMLGSFPAGLVIYWAWNNLLSILQQSFIMKRHGVEVKLMDNVREDFGWIADLVKRGEKGPSKT